MIGLTDRRLGRSPRDLSEPLGTWLETRLVPVNPRASTNNMKVLVLRDITKMRSNYKYCSSRLLYLSIEDLL
jgi:hypothetical protein